MAEQYIIQAETLTKMADALRTITGEPDASFTPAEMVKVVSHLYADILYGDEIVATVDNAGYLVINSGDAPNVDFAAVYGLVGTWVQGGTGKGVPIYVMTADGDAVAVQIGGSGSSYETSVVNDPSLLNITKNSVRYFIDPNCLIASSTTTHTFKVRLVYSCASASDGVELPELNNEGTASDLLAGKELIDGEGNVVTGTIATKTESNLTVSGPTVTVPAGYYATQATKSVATVAQATPSISVSSSGLITASATQTAGYVSAGTKSGTKQLTTQAAKTITPSTSFQTAVASGRYTTGVVTVAAIPSNYEDVGTETNAYTSKIASLESAVTALETELAGKASGGGSLGATFDTCTVRIVCDSGNVDSVGGCITRVVNNELRVQEFVELGVAYEDVLCGSGIQIMSPRGALLAATADYGTILYYGIDCKYQAPKTAGVVATLELVPD